MKLALGIYHKRPLGIEQDLILVWMRGMLLFFLLRCLLGFFGFQQLFAIFDTARVLLCIKFAVT